MPNRLTSAASYFVALAIGVGFVAWMFPVGRLFPLHPLDAALTGDAAQHVIGQRYFIQDAWRWPLFVTPRLNAPDGANVAMTDSIPFIAILLKLIRGWLPAGFTVTESWVAIAFVLQPVAAVYALRCAGEKRFVPALALSAIALSVPTLLARFLGQHEALCSHFLILLAIGLYFRQTAASAARWTGRVAVPALLVCSLLIHPYILGMVAIFLAAAPLTLLLRWDRRWRAAAIVFAEGCVLTVIVALVLGYGGSDPSPGFGTYSMNMLAPLQPRYSTLFDLTWADPTGGQAFEGFQYLGAGVVLLALAGLAAAIKRKGTRRRVVAHAGLAVICLALYAFSLSNQVYFGHHRLIGFSKVPGFVQQFRASGRFFWPVTYVIIIASLVALAPALRMRWLAALLVLCVGLQVADTSHLRNDDWTAEHRTETWFIPHDALRPVFAASSVLSLWPPQPCDISSAGIFPYMQTLLLASAFNLTTNTMYLSRGPAGLSCDPVPVLAQPWRPGELRVISYPASTELRQLVPNDAETCRQVGIQIICAERPEPLAAFPRPAPSYVPRGVMLDMANPAAMNIMAGNWSTVEPTGRWSLGKYCLLLAERAPGTPPPTRLTLHGFGVASRGGGTQHVDVLVDGKIIAGWEMLDFQDKIVTADLPPGLTGRLAVTFRIAEPIRPVDRHMGTDARTLGLFVKGVQID